MLKNIFCAYFSCIQNKNYFLLREHTFNKRNPFIDSLFSYFRDFFYINFNQFEDFYFAYILVVTRKKNHFLWCEYAFFEEKRKSFRFYDLNRDSKRKVFTFFVHQFFFQIWLRKTRQTVVCASFGFTQKFFLWLEYALKK